MGHASAELAFQENNISDIIIIWSLIVMQRLSDLWKYKNWIRSYLSNTLTRLRFKRQAWNPYPQGFPALGGAQYPTFGGQTQNTKCIGAVSCHCVYFYKTLINLILSFYDSVLATSKMSLSQII